MKFLRDLASKDIGLSMGWYSNNHLLLREYFLALGSNLKLMTRREADKVANHWHHMHLQVKLRGLRPADVFVFLYPNKYIHGMNVTKYTEFNDAKSSTMVRTTNHSSVGTLVSANSPYFYPLVHIWAKDPTMLMMVDSIEGNRH